VQAVAKRLHAPKGMPLAEIYGWLAHIEKNRNIAQPLATIAAEIDDLIAQKSPDNAALLAAARNLYRWKEDILNGPTTN
jgi:hypothetical protein